MGLAPVPPLGGEEAFEELERAVRSSGVERSSSSISDEWTFDGLEGAISFL